MTGSFLPGVLMVFLSVPGDAGPVRLSDGTDGCVVATESYRLDVDVRAGPLVRLMTADGRRELGRLQSVWIEQDGRRYQASAAEPRPHFHPLRSGPYLVELHIENIVLRAGEATWPGLAEVSLFCHADRVYILAAFICSDGRWVNRGMYVYEALEGHRSWPSVAPSAWGLDLGAPPGGEAPLLTDVGAVVPGPRAVAIRATVPPTAQAGLVRDAFTISAGPDGTAWEPGSVHEVGGVATVCDGADDARQALTAEGEPLGVEAFEMSMGQALGFDPARGVYRLAAQTSGTPDPPAGLRAGAHYTLRNDERERRILIDQRDPWGGIGGGIIRDGEGEPLPVVVQFGLNFPELHQEAGEPGWATLTYPLDLAPRQTRQIRAEHLYRSLSDRDIIYLTSLDNVGDPLLLQTTVGRGESHTLTTGPYPRALKPGNELRVNDFRRIYSQVRVRSVSAILPTFFGYWDAAGEYQGLMPGFVSFRETSPFLIEYTVEAATRDGAITGSVRVWQAAHQDMTRLFTEVSLDVNRTVRLNAERPAALLFLRHHAFNPMAFRRFAFTADDGRTREGELTYARTVVANGVPMGEQPFACIYRADNPIDQGIPCSDITGNSGFVLLDWDVRLGGRQIRPGCYAFCTGAEDEEDGAYARDVAAVPTERVTEIPAGSHIRYRAVQMVYGDNASDYAAMERERERWALNPLRVTAEVGEAVSSDPPEVRARGGRIKAEISGGTDWMPVRVSGFEPGSRLHVRQADSTAARELGPGKPDEPWHNAWPSEDGKCGFTFLVKTDPKGPIRLEVWQ